MSNICIFKCLSMAGTREWRTPPVVGVFLKLDWMKNLEEAFVSFPLAVESGSFAQTSSSSSGFDPLYFPT